MRVFISHQKRDAALASQISLHLQHRHLIASYLDIVDPHLDRKGEDLAQHIREQMSSCTQLLAVVSEATKASQWVPWEIGVATEKDLPLATYSQSTEVPEFLRKWPLLQSFPALDDYAQASKAADATFRSRRRTLHETASASQQVSTRAFYSDLRKRLGQ